MPNGRLRGFQEIFVSLSHFYFVFCFSICFFIGDIFKMLKVFSVFDSKADAYILPFFCVNTAVAIRGFSLACKDETSQFCRHPGDFTLFEVGTWDETPGLFVPYEAKISLGTALEFKALSEGGLT